MNPLNLDDSRFLAAATGWLGLGNWHEANEELECITAGMRSHPEVLMVRYEIYSAAKNWPLALEVARAITELVPAEPFGWVNHASTLHKLKRTQDAFDSLLPAVGNFPKEHTIRYKLACYACQLGKLHEAMIWLEQAIDLAGKNDIRLMALDDPDLEPLWNQIGEI